MANIALTQVGGAIGSAVLPNGLSVFGQTFTGAAVGRFVGGLAGRAIDASLRPPIEGPRVRTLSVMESREGAGLPTVYGRYRVGGQVIWASRFREQREEQSAGKGGPKYTEYSYTVSFAVALCEGPITRVDRIWANNEPMELGAITWRLYTGTEEQLPDPLIESIEGTGQVPAYRGTAYIVFEDLPLEAYGNRMPQLSFEVVRAGAYDPDTLRDLVRGVNIIPASGEFVYGTTIVRERRFPGIERALNMNNGDGRSDFVVSLDQMQADLPKVSSAALTVAWFGTSTEADECALRPGVETYGRSTVPYDWSVDDIGRGEAHLISRDDNDSAVYGGTPADECVLEGIAALYGAGVAVTLSPFILMDSEGFPWRGRITASSDGTANAREAVNAFVGVDGDFGFRHFILHHARLAAEAAQRGTPVEAFLLGSEMVALTRVRDDAGLFPFVEALTELASEVRAIVGPNVKISYAADWTEYGAYVPADGSGDVFFPLDSLWMTPEIDFVGVDWYPPAGDWRDGDEHLDLEAGYKAADDPSYLFSNMAGGEGYDWYYANVEDRDDQVRTPIIDTAHSEDWVFRQKDLASWWGTEHFERPNGIRSVSPTVWAASSKPIRIVEIGFPAVDRGGNGPNVFYDPKSDESAFPPYSSGSRDDLYQRRALEVALSYWQSRSFVEDVMVWAWDGRPFPHWPNLTNVWSDGPNWQFGHWLNGRTGLIAINEVVSDLAARAGVAIDVSELAGFVDGYALEGVSDLRSAIAPLEAAYGTSLIEHQGALTFRQGGGPIRGIDTEHLIEDSFRFDRTLLDKRPGALIITYVDGEGAYDAATAEALNSEGDRDYAIRLTLPMVMGDARARDLAGRLLQETLLATRGQISLGPAALDLEPSDRVLVNNQVWQIDSLREDGLRRDMSLLPVRGADAVRAIDAPDSGPPALVRVAPEFIIIDAIEGDGPIVAVSASPWPGLVRINVGPDLSNMTERAIIETPAGLGELLDPLEDGPLGRWDHGNELLIRMAGEDLSSVSELGVLGGSNRLFVEGETGWELLSFTSADLIDEDVWRLSGLLRGLSGTAPTPAIVGARVVLADARLETIELGREEVGLLLLWQANDGEAYPFLHEDIGSLPLPVGHLRTDGTSIRWTRRSREISPNWNLAEAENEGQFAVEWLSAESVIQSEEIMQASLPIHPSVDEVRVAQKGVDGRVGPWVSISLESS